MTYEDKVCELVTENLSTIEIKDFYQWYFGKLSFDFYDRISHKTKDAILECIFYGLG